MTVFPARLTRPAPRRRGQFALPANLCDRAVLDEKRRVGDRRAAVAGDESRAFVQHDRRRPLATAHSERKSKVQRSKCKVSGAAVPRVACTLNLLCTFYLCTLTFKFQNVKLALNWTMRPSCSSEGCSHSGP